MKIIIKTIKGEAFTIEIEPENTIKEVKQKLQEQRGIDANLSQLIHKGRKTTDENTIKSYDIKEGDFMVVMIKKVQSNQSQQQTQSQTEKKSENETSTQNQAEQNNQQQQTFQTVQQQQQQSNQQQQQQQSQGGIGMVQGEQFNKMVDEISAMGFPKKDIENALRAAYMNPDRAIEYLISGIPPNLAQQQNQQAPGLGFGQNIRSQEQNNNQSERDLPMPGLGGFNQNQSQNQAQQQSQQQQQNNQQSNPLAGLAASPIFQQLRAAIQQNPQLLQVVLSQIEHSNPQLFEVIQQNQEQFISMLNSGSEGYDIGQGEFEQEGMGFQGGTGTNRGFYGQNVISVTPEENAAIERLIQLGFLKHQVIEAYLACDKNEEIAANYLFDAQMRGDYMQDDEQLGQNTQQQSALSQQQLNQQNQQQQMDQQKNQQQTNQSSQNQEKKQEDQQQKQDNDKDQENKAQNQSNQNKKDDDNDDDTIFS